MSIPVFFTWDPIGNGIHVIVGLVCSRSSPLGITICICGGKVLEISSCTGAAASSYSQWWHIRWWLSHSLWFHRLSWTVAATVHVSLTVLGVWVGFLGAPPLFPISPPASSWLRVHLLPIEGTITHCKFTCTVSFPPLLYHWYLDNT